MAPAALPHQLTLLAQDKIRAEGCPWAAPIVSPVPGQRVFHLYAFSVYQYNTLAVSFFFPTPNTPASSGHLLWTWDPLPSSF